MNPARYLTRSAQRNGRQTPASPDVSQQVIVAKISKTSAVHRYDEDTGARGFTLIELIIVLLIGTILTAMAVPQVKTQMNYHRLNSAVAMAKWAIQSTRFQALAKGYPYQVVFSATNVNYQIQNLPTGAVYQNIGTVVPLASWPMTFNADTTISFKPNGAVTATVGSNVFTITYQGTTKTITVSNYGNVTVQ
jgi:prepilin-type N-terminal cleavage/methylation domain-containing protein